jgi:ribonuclease HII
LAGPVVAAAVILDDARAVAGLADSKTLSEKQRQVLYREITNNAAATAIGVASVDEIDRLNILQAALLAMRRAVEELTLEPDQVLVDGRFCPDVKCEARPVVKGDATVRVISAASIVAKVTRDRMMMVLDARYPDYGFSKHKGHPTPAHLETLGRLGPTPVHRRSFGPVRRALRVIE